MKSTLEIFGLFLTRAQQAALFSLGISAMQLVIRTWQGEARSDRCIYCHGDSSSDRCQKKPSLCDTGSSVCVMYRPWYRAYRLCVPRSASARCPRCISSVWTRRRRLWSPYRRPPRRPGRASRDSPGPAGKAISWRRRRQMARRAPRRLPQRPTRSLVKV